MKFLVDECVGSSVAKWLQENGYDVVSIADESPGIIDDEVLYRAISENRILITSDKDFGELVFKKQRQHCGIVLMRLSNEHPLRKIEIIKQVLTNYHENLPGNYVVVTDAAVRIIIKNVFSSAKR